MELIISIFSFVGSLTLFLFGMKTMIELSKTKSSTKINIKIKSEVTQMLLRFLL